MPNTLLTSQIVTNELLRRFKNNLGFVAGMSHSYDDRFKAKVGDTISLREGARFVANDGVDVTSQIQNAQDTAKSLQISQRKNVAFQFSSSELTLSIDRFAERYLDGAAVALANAFDVAALTYAYQHTPNRVGTPGTTPATARVFLDAGAVLDNHSCPVDSNRSVAINPATQASMVDVLKGLFNSGSEVSRQYRRGRMGEALGFDWVMDQNIRRHTVGAWAGAPLVKGASQSGATLLVDGLTEATTVKAGDIFSIGTTIKCYAVNPASGDQLPDVRQFVNLTDQTVPASGELALSIYPAIYATGGLKSVNVAPANDETINLLGTASTAYPINLAYHKDAFCFAMAELEMPKGVHFGARQTDPESGLSIRMVSDYNVLTDVFVTRCDIAFGFAGKHPEWACQIIG